MTKYRRKQMALRALPEPRPNTLASGQTQCKWSDVWFAFSILAALMVVASIWTMP